MENFFARYKNPLVLMAVLFIQVVALATQVKRQENGRDTGGGTRLIRVWTVTAFTPVEKMFVSTGSFFRNGWHNYVDLRNVRKQNRELQDEVARLQMEQARLKQDADQARRLQALLDFREKFVAKTLVAQVIGTSGTEQSRVILIDKGSRDGIKTDMAVITPDGIVGKIKDVFPLSSQVLLISDRDSGAGVILESNRLQGILKGSAQGDLQIADVMSDEKVEAGEHVITSGGDRIFPKGLSVGTVTSSSPDRDNDPFLSIRIKPAADLRRLEEVMVITKMAEEVQAPSGSAPMRAADILSQRLPSIPKQDPNAPKTPGAVTTPAGNPSTGADPAKKQIGPAPDQKPEQNNKDQKKESSGSTAAVKPPPAASVPAKSPTPSGKPLAGATAGGSAAAGTTTGGKPAAAASPAGTNPNPSSKPATATKKPAGVGQPASSRGDAGGVGTGGTGAGGAATPTPAPKPKATPPKKSSPSAAAPGASPSAPDGKKPEPPETSPAATPTATPERAPR
jgi:rod shape-determining protein MreC